MSSMSKDVSASTSSGTNRVSPRGGRLEAVCTGPVLPPPVLVEPPPPPPPPGACPPVTGGGGKVPPPDDGPKTGGAVAGESPKIRVPIAQPITAKTIPL